MCMHLACYWGLRNVLHRWGLNGMMFLKICWKLAGDKHIFISTYFFFLTKQKINLRKLLLAMPWRGINSFIAKMFRSAVVGYLLHRGQTLTLVFERFNTRWRLSALRRQPFVCSNVSQLTFRHVNRYFVRKSRHQKKVIDFLLNFNLTYWTRCCSYNKFYVVALTFVW